MATQIIVIFGVMAAALGALFIFARVSKSKDPLMKGGCHGDCSSCGAHCDDADKKRSE